MGIDDAGSHSSRTLNIDLIDCLPPGLYEAVIDAKTADSASGDLMRGDYVSRFAERTLDDIRSLGVNSLEDERCFAAAQRLSEVTHGLYRTTVQPVVKTLVTEQSSEWVKQNRQPASPDNPFLASQQICSDFVTQSLNSYRELRDRMIEQTFFGVCNQPWLQAMLGLRSTPQPHDINSCSFGVYRSYLACFQVISSFKL